MKKTQFFLSVREKKRHPSFRTYQEFAISISGEIFSEKMQDHVLSQRDPYTLRLSEYDGGETIQK